MGKNIILGGKLGADLVGDPQQSNVFKIINAVDVRDQEHPQIIFYENRVQDANNKYMRAFSGSFGFGLKRNVLELYEFLAMHYDPGDRVFMFGFSRGAAEVQALSGLIAAAGLVDGRNMDKDALDENIVQAYRHYKHKRPGLLFHNHGAIDLTFIGVWDTISALGFPRHWRIAGIVSPPLNVLFHGLDWLCDQTFFAHRFYNYELTPNVRHAYQALAIDDERLSFEPRIWKEPEYGDTKVEQVWFAGAHSNVGGGCPNSGLANITLDWMMTRAAQRGLVFKNGTHEEVKRNAHENGLLYNERNGLGVFYRYYPRIIADLCREKIPSSTPIKIHSSVLKRLKQKTGNYAPGYLPPTFDIVNEASPSTSVTIKDPKWEALQAQLQKWTKWRSYLYGAFLEVPLFLLGIALWLWGWAPSSVQKADDSQEAIGATLHYLAKTLKYILPAMFENLINLVVVQQPLYTLAAVLVILGLLWLRGWVRKNYYNVCEAARDILLKTLQHSQDQKESSSQQLKTSRSTNNVLKEQLEHINNKLRGTPKNLDFLREKATILRDLERHRDYKVISDKIDEIVSEEEFIANLSQKITIQSLEVKELEFFGSFTWNFSPDISVLLGKNGYGKSHLLSLIIALLQKDKKILETFFSDQSSREASVKLTVERNGKPHVIHFTKLGFEESIGKIPILAISELRFIDKSKDSFTKEEIGNESDPINDGAYRFLRHLPTGPIIQNFILSFCVAYDKLDQEKKDTFELPIIHLFYKVFRTLTSQEFDFNSIDQIDDQLEYKITVLTEGNDRPVLLQHASQGVLSVMAMVSLIFNYLKLVRTVRTSTGEKNLADGYAIVFIDELDAHLHPSWQRKLLGLLRNCFPNIQFIVASHSPLVVAGRKEREVAVLRKKENEPGFYLQEIDQHFVGATTNELYQALFEIEEKDETYLKYAAMYPFRKDIKKAIERLENTTRLDEQDEKKLYDLHTKKLEFDNAKMIAQKLLEKSNRTPKEEKTLQGIFQLANISTQKDQTPRNLDKMLSLDSNEEETMDRLRDQQSLSPGDKKKLDELHEDLYYINEFKKVENEREQKKALEEKF